jgi:membrane-bound serine protease (ClpP class)
MIGERGIAKERLAPAGYVQVRGELWRAFIIDDGPAIETGQSVKIVKMDGLTLFVEPVTSGE